jgi:hypothetical protein
VPLADGQRVAFEPLVTEVARQRDLFTAGGYVS